MLYFPLVDFFPFISHLISAIIVVSASAIVSVATLGHGVPSTHVSPVQLTPSMVTPVAINKDMLRASTTITMVGKIIQLTMMYPKAGGSITGTIQGDCAGEITGQFEGMSSGMFRGNAQVTCKQGVLTVPARIIYTGKMESQTKATINYTISAMGQSFTGTTALIFLQ